MLKAYGNRVQCRKTQLPEVHWLRWQVTPSLLRSRGVLGLLIQNGRCSPFSVCWELPIIVMAC